MEMRSSSPPFPSVSSILLVAHHVHIAISCYFHKLTGNLFVTGVFWRIHQVDPIALSWLLVLVTIGATWLVAFAYKNTKFVLKHKIAQKRENAVSREVMKAIADDKKMSRKEKDERVLWKKNEVADYEATTFSIFYNNALFLALVVVGSMFVLSSFAPALNYVLSVAGSAGLIALFSTGSQ